MRFKDSCKHWPENAWCRHICSSEFNQKKNGMLIEMNNFLYKFHEYSKLGVLFWLCFQLICNVNWCYRRYLLLFWIKSVFLKKERFFPCSNSGDYEMLSKWNICNKYCLRSCWMENRLPFFRAANFTLLPFRIDFISSSCVIHDMLAVWVVARTTSKRQT